MTIKKGVQNKFNRGEVSKEAFAREDVKPIDNSCELLENFQAERLGPAMYRPGTELIDIVIDNEPILVEFITEIADPLLLIFGLGAGTPTMKVLRADALIARTSVTSAMQNQLFSTGFAGGEWVDADEGSAASTIGSGILVQTGTGTDSAKVYQTLDSTETGELHGFEIRVVKGTVLFQMGTTGVDSADLFEGKIGIGIHHIEVTPDAALTVTISNDAKIVSHVTSCELLGNETTVIALEDALDASILTSADYAKLKSLRVAQSADVMYFTSKHFLPFKVTRWNATSYSLERYENVFGPYEFINVSSVTMNPTAPLDGDMEVVASKQFFDSNSTFGFAKGTLIKLAVTGQAQTATGSDSNVETAGVFVFGSGDARKFTIDIDTTSAYTEVRLEKSFDEITWQLVKSYTSGSDVVAEVYDDGLDAAEIYYRLQVQDIGGASTITLTITYSYGTLEAQGRIHTLNSVTSVDVGWYVDLTIDQTTRDWYIGSWGGKREFPSAIAFYEGRLWFAGGNKIWGSETDFYTSFDRTIEGASASIQRTIGFGSAEEILWLAPAARLVAGLATGEVDIKSTSFGEILTPLNTNLKLGSDLGVAAVEPILLDGELLFIQRGGNKLVGLDFGGGEKHTVIDFNTLNTTILNPIVSRMSYARNPETRIFIVLEDGKMRVMLRDPIGDVLGWFRYEIQRVIGTGRFADSVLDVAVLPGVSGIEDQIYIAVDVPGGPDVTNLTNDVLQRYDYSEFIADFSGFKFNSDMTTAFVLDTSDNTLFEFSLFTAGDLSSIFYSGRSAVINSNATGFTVKPDGTQIWMVYGSVVIISYTLSVAWDITTLDLTSIITVTDPDSIDAGSPDMEEIYGLEWNPDGTKVYIVGGGGSTNTYVYQFTAATVFDIETLTLDGEVQLSGILGGAVQLAIEANGINWYAMDTNDLSDQVEKYINSTAWDLTTASYDSDISIASGAVVDYFQLLPGDAGFWWHDANDVGNAVEIADLKGTAWDSISGTSPPNSTAIALREANAFVDPTGLRIYVSSNDLIYQYSMSVAYDITTIAYIGVSPTLEVPAESHGQYHMFIDSGGTKMILADRYDIWAYTMSSAWDITSATYDTGETYNFKTDGDGSTWGHNMWFSSDGAKFWITDHNQDTIAGVIIEFTVSPAWQVSNAVESANQVTSGELDVTEIESDNSEVFGFCFSEDGFYFWLCMWNAGWVYERVFEYAMSTAFDITTALFNNIILELVGTIADTTEGFWCRAPGTTTFTRSGNNLNNTELSTHSWPVAPIPKLYKSVAGFGASTQGKLLKFCQTDEVAGGLISKHFDTFMQFSSPGTTITLSANGGYLVGMTVGVWVDGVDDGDYTLDSSLQITGVTSGTDVIVGFRYIADYISNKLTGYDDAGVLNSRKRILNTGFIMKDYVPGSLKVGSSLTRLENMPVNEDGVAAESGDYDFFPFPYDGGSETDPRIAFRATGPCKIMALSYDVKDTATKEKTKTTEVA